MTGPYGTAAQPMATQNYIYGADGQPRMMAGTPVNYADSHKMRDKGNLRYDWDTDTGPGRGRVIARHFNGASGPGSPGYKPGKGKGGGYGPCNNPGNAQTPLCDPNATQPGNGPAGDQAVRQDIAYNYMNRMERVDVRVDPHLTAIDPDYTVGYVYDSDGNRFQKRYADSNRSVTTHYPAPDYQIRYGGVDEAHTLIVRKADGLLATFSFPASYYLAGGVSSSQQGSQLAHLWERLGDPGFDTISGAGDAFALLYGYARTYEGWGVILYRVLAVVSLLVVLVFLFTWWRRYDLYGNAMDKEADNRSFTDINSIPNTLFGFRDLPHRLTASTMILSLYAMTLLSCSGGGSGSEIILPPGSGNFRNDVAAGLIGGHFFLTDPVGSVSLITDADGKPVTRYVYGPYGELNMELSNPDLDGDGMLFESIYKYNGQEFDYEIGLYNYRARMYDQKAGRFLTTDPVMTENRGFDSYDPYGYVSGNPVNFTDPDGERAHFPMFWDHMYTLNGNADYLSGQHELINYVFEIDRDDPNTIYLKVLEDPKKNGFLLGFIAPEPRTKLDRYASLVHDRTMPGANFIGCKTGDGEGQYCRSRRMDANKKFIKGASGIMGPGLLLGIAGLPLTLGREVWDQPFHQAIGDLVAGTLGMVAFGVDNLLTYMSDPNVRARNKTKQRQEELFTLGAIGNRYNRVLHKRMKNGESTEFNSVFNEVAREAWGEYVNYEVSKANKRIGKAFNKWMRMHKLFKMWPN